MYTEKMLAPKTDTHQGELAKLIEKFTTEDGTYSTAIPSLKFIRSSKPSEPIHVLHEPALCVVVQGTKIVGLAQESYQYDPNHYLVVSVDLPIIGEILVATHEIPYLCLRLDFQATQIFDIINQIEPSKKNAEPSSGLFVNKMNVSLLDAIKRLVSLLDNPGDIPILAPMIIREILYRILCDENGDSVRQIAISGSNTQRIGDVIKLIKDDISRPFRIEELASIINMSSSSLHHHFKQVTKMSPLQYQKQLRLQEARRLMLTGDEDAANAGFKVGYESPSQFNREYARMFGLPPITDIKKLRES